MKSMPSGPQGSQGKDKNVKQIPITKPTSSTGGSCRGTCTKKDHGTAQAQLRGKKKWLGSLAISAKGLGVGKPHMCPEFAIPVLGDISCREISSPPGEVDWVQVQVENKNVPMATCFHLRDFTNYGETALTARKDLI